MAALESSKEVKPTTNEEKNAKEREWSDVNEDVKFVCHGGKVQCKYCTPPIADIIVTSTQIMLQDKPMATTGDTDGKVNFNFTGVCMHPSQQKPLAPPPPCKAVISLGRWKDYSDTLVDNYNALLVKSKIPCMISGEDLEVIHSGQMATLTDVEPKMTRQPKVVDVYWKEDGNDEKLYIERPGESVTLFIETEDYEEGEMVKVAFIADEGMVYEDGSTKLSISGVVGEDGVAIIKGFVINYKQI